MWLPTVVYDFLHGLDPAQIANVIQCHFSPHSYVPATLLFNLFKPQCLYPFSFPSSVCLSIYRQLPLPCSLLCPPSFPLSLSFSPVPFPCPPEMSLPKFYMADLTPYAITLGMFSLIILIKGAALNYIILFITLYNIHNHLKFKNVFIHLFIFVSAHAQACSKKQGNCCHSTVFLVPRIMPAVCKLLSTWINELMLSKPLLNVKEGNHRLVFTLLSL